MKEKTLSNWGDDMRFIIDSIRFQNSSAHLPSYDTVAEMGIEVDHVCTYFDEDDPVRAKIDKQTHIEDGYYYVTVFRKKDNWSNISSTYLVSLSSVLDYLYGYTLKENVPHTIERYSRIEDAINSAFIDYFLRLEWQIQESESVRMHNISTMTLGKTIGYDISISIESATEFKITAKSKLESDDSISFELLIDSEGGHRVIHPDKHIDLIRPYMMFYIKRGTIVDEYPTLSFVGCNSFFRALYDLEKYTAKELKDYFEQNDLHARLTEEDYSSLRQGLLGFCLGEPS